VSFHLLHEGTLEEVEATEMEVVALSQAKPAELELAAPALYMVGEVSFLYFLEAFRALFYIELLVCSLVY
jgi:hypothetical protein